MRMLFVTMWLMLQQLRIRLARCLFTMLAATLGQKLHVHMTTAFAVVKLLPQALVEDANRSLLRWYRRRMCMPSGGLRGSSTLRTSTSWAALMLGSRTKELVCTPDDSPCTSRPVRHAVHCSGGMLMLFAMLVCCVMPIHFDVPCYATPLLCKIQPGLALLCLACYAMLWCAERCA